MDMFSRINFLLGVGLLTAIGFYFAGNYLIVWPLSHIAPNWVKPIAGVAVLADIHFGRRVPGDGQHIRFSYAASKDAIEKGVQRMSDFVRRNVK